jgi:CheY-like chemotaxis protein
MIPRARQPHVLVIGRALSRLETTKDYFTVRNYSCIVVGSLREALAQIMGQRPPNLILVSMNLQRANVPRFLKLVEAQFKIPTVAFFETIDATIEYQARLEGVYEILPAPLNNARLFLAAQALRKNSLGLGASASYGVVWVNNQAQQKRLFVLRDQPVRRPAPLTMVVQGVNESLALRGQEKVVRTKRLDKVTFSRARAQTLAQQRDRTNRDTATGSVQKQDSTPAATLASNTENSLLATCAIRAIKDAGPIQPRPHFGRDLNASVVTISTLNFRGYLLTSLANKAQLDEPYIQNVKWRLKDILTLRGEPPVEEPLNFAMNIKPQMFREWAERSADFNLTTHHGAHDIHLTFVSSPEPLPALLRATTHPTLIGVHASDIAPNQKLDFDLYLHLPLNSKYVKISATGGVLTSTQYARLLEHNRSMLYIDESARERFCIFVAKARLEARFKEFVG